MTLTTPHLIGQHYAYAIGRLGALEDQLLKTTDIDRLLGASDGAESVKMLRDIEFIATPESDEAFQETLNSTTALLKETVERMIPEPKHFIFNILWIDFDRPWIAYKLKEKHGFTSQIATPPSPPVSTRFASEFDQEFKTPQEIDDVVAESINEQKLMLAKRSGSALIRSFVEKTMNLEALRVRTRSAGSVTRVAGTTTSNTRVAGHDSSPTRDAGSNSSATRDSDTNSIETIAFEKEGVAQLSDLLDDMQQMMLGPEATFSYAVRALNHIQLLKILLTGKVNNLPIQEVKSLLPPLV